MLVNNQTRQLQVNFPSALASEPIETKKNLRGNIIKNNSGPIRKPINPKGIEKSGNLDKFVGEFLNHSKSITFKKGATAFTIEHQGQGERGKGNLADPQMRVLGPSSDQPVKAMRIAFQREKKLLGAVIVPCRDKIPIDLFKKAITTSMKADRVVTLVDQQFNTVVN